MSQSSYAIANCLLTAVLLTCSVKAIQFNCIFEMRISWAIATRYTCDASVINSGSSALESVTGVHLPERSNEDVGFIVISLQNLPHIPDGITDVTDHL